MRSLQNRTVKLTAAAAIAVLLGTTACTTDPDTGQQRLSRAGAGALIGTGGGALLGAIVGGRSARTETLVGAGIGAIAGAGVGAYMDRQERQLRERTQGTGIEVERRGDELALRLPDGVTFDFGSANVRGEFRTPLQQVAQTLNEFPSTFVDVYGHTDNVGSLQVNQRLSEQRAQAVADVLTGFGVNRARMATRGFAYTQPIADNATEQGRARNRRVEVRLIPVSEQDVSAVRR